MRSALGYERDTETVAEFINANYYQGDMDTEEFLWELISKVSNGDELRAMYFANEEVEDIVARAQR